MTIQRESTDLDSSVEGIEPSCKSLPAVDVHAATLKHSQHTSHDVAWKKWTWNVIKVGDCTLENGTLQINADGTAIFWGFASTTDNDDAWVFYGGVSLLDAHGAVLWTSPKLVGPSMSEGGTYEWETSINYPPVWFDSTTGARINQAHC
jgi:hypothetical protein